MQHHVLEAQISLGWDDVHLSKLAVLEVLLHLDTELVGDVLELYTRRIRQSEMRACLVSSSSHVCLEIIPRTRQRRSTAKQQNHMLIL